MWHGKPWSNQSNAKYFHLNKVSSFIPSIFISTFIWVKFHALSINWTVLLITCHGTILILILLNQKKAIFCICLLDIVYINIQNNEWNQFHVYWTLSNNENFTELKYYSETHIHIYFLCDLLLLKNTTIVTISLINISSSIKHLFAWTGSN